MKFLTKACFGMLLAASAMSTPAFAQEEEASGPVSLSGGVSVVSDYRFRGISQTARDPALLQGLPLAASVAAALNAAGLQATQRTP